MFPDPDWEPFSTRRATCPACPERSPDLPDPWAFLDWRESHECKIERKAA